ncbi:hypothetical protein N0824_02490 [Microcystis sp. 0824]|nr:hypothetical protein N0824_02490 [Microcystis sp. 0824]
MGFFLLCQIWLLKIDYLFLLLPLRSPRTPKVPINLNPY